MTRVLRRITFLLTLTAVEFGLSSSHAQQIIKLHRIGYLDSGSFPGIEALLRDFERKLSELGWVEEKNILLDYQFANGRGSGRLQELANELAKRRVEVIVTRGTSGAATAWNCVILLGKPACRSTRSRICPVRNDRYECAVPIVQTVAGTHPAHLSPKQLNVLNVLNCLNDWNDNCSRRFMYKSRAGGYQ